MTTVSEFSFLLVPQATDQMASSWAGREAPCKVSVPPTTGLRPCSSRAEADAPRSAAVLHRTRVADRGLHSWGATYQNGGSAEASCPKHRLTHGKASGVF